MKYVCAIFAPLLVAIVVRILSFISAYVLIILGEIWEFLSNANKIANWYTDFCETLAGFETFVWDESWFYWGFVVVVTFFVEIAIFDKDNNW